MGQWVKHWYAMYQIRGSDDPEDFRSFLNMREFQSSIDRRKRHERRKNWLDPVEGTVRQFRRKTIRRENDLQN